MKVCKKCKIKYTDDNILYCSKCNKKLDSVTNGSSTKTGKINRGILTLAFVFLIIYIGFKIAFYGSPPAIISIVCLPSGLLCLIWAFVAPHKTTTEYQPQTSIQSIPQLVTCPACGQQISNQAAACPSCGQPTGVHVCPKCGSTDTKVISDASKAVSVGIFGIFAANKVLSKYHCNNCGYKF